MEKLVAIYTYMKQEERDIEEEILSKDGITVEEYNTDEEFLKNIERIDVLVLANPELDRSLIEKMIKCKGIIRRGVGYDNIDLEAARDRNMVVCNVPDYCYQEVSDLAVGLMLAIVKRIPMYSNDVKQSIWHIDSPEDTFLAKGMHNMTLGLAGFGNIAREVARKAKPFFGDVIASDPFVSEEFGKEHGVTLVSKEDLLMKSDVISLHVPSNKHTYHYINNESLKIMKDKSYIINTARGQLIDEKALYEALESKKIAGVALDVTDPEPPESDNPLLNLNNVIPRNCVGR